jgi:hypothetical protein
MKYIHVLTRRLYQNGPSAILVVVVTASVGLGIPAAKTLGDPPYYSFDKDSPTVLDTGNGIDAKDILELDYVAGIKDEPRVVVEGAMLGLAHPDDDLDALSANNGGFAAAALFNLLVSITELSVGVAGPDDVLAALGVPYNCAEQAGKIQAACDQCSSLFRFTPAGRMTEEGESARALGTNFLLRNQYNEGGSDFGGVPYIPAAAFNVGVVQDELNATMMSRRISEGITEVYFSVSSSSPSPIGLNNGATIFYDPGPAGAGPTTVYASHGDLGLQQADDIDGMIVFDNFGDEWVFDIGDIVLFSLIWNSPSLNTIPGASAEGAAADVFIVTAGGSPTVFAPASDLGLGDENDNVDALDYLPCAEPTARDCALEYGIRGQPIPIPAVTEWGLVVMVLLGLAAGTIMFRAKRRAAAA